MNSFLVPMLARQSYSRSEVAIVSVHFPWVFNCRSFVRHLQSMMPTRNNQSQNYMEKQNKTKTHLLLSVIGRFGPHLTIVMIFVTQNNFKNGPGISDRLLGFYLL